MQHVFWLRPGKIAGRSGPSMNPWQASELAAAGIDAILSVNDAASVYADELAAAGIEHLCLPMEDNAPPRPGDFEAALEILPRALTFLDRVIERGGVALIHCTAGKDRTGLTLCYYLCQREGLAPLEALREVRRVRPQALSAIDYEPFALEILAALRPVR